MHIRLLHSKSHNILNAYKHMHSIVGSFVGSTIKYNHSDSVIAYYTRWYTEHSVPTSFLCLSLAISHELILPSKLAIYVSPRFLLQEFLKYNHRSESVFMFLYIQDSVCCYCILVHLIVPNRVSCVYRQN